MFTESWSCDQVMQRASYVTVLDSSKCACSHQRWYRCQSLLRFYVVGQKWLKDATCGRGFVWKMRRELSVFKQKRLCVERALVFNGTEESLIAWIISLSAFKSCCVLTTLLYKWLKYEIHISIVPVALVAAYSLPRDFRSWKKFRSCR